MYVYNISGGVAHTFYQSCAEIDNNQQVYEVQIQVPKCNSILKAGSHECQKLRPLHLHRCTGTQTTVPRQLTLHNVIILSSIWARSCFGICVSILRPFSLIRCLVVPIQEFNRKLTRTQEVISNQKAVPTVIGDN